MGFLWPYEGSGIIAHLTRCRKDIRQHLFRLVEKCRVAGRKTGKARQSTRIGEAWQNESFFVIFKNTWQLKGTEHMEVGKRMHGPGPGPLGTC